MIDRMQIHHNLLRQTEEKYLPVIGTLYRNYDMEKFCRVHRGTVSEITDDGFYIKKCNGRILKIIIAPETYFLHENEIKENDIVVISGKEDGGAVRAVGISKVDDSSN